MKKSQISTVVNVETEARLRQQAKEQGISLSELIRRTLEAEPKNDAPFSLGEFNMHEAQKRSDSIDLGLVIATAKDSAKIIEDLQNCRDEYKYCKEDYKDIQHTLSEMDERLQRAVFYMTVTLQVILRKETYEAIKKDFDRQYFAND